MNEQRELCVALHVLCYCAGASDTFGLGYYNLYTAQVSYTFTIPCPISQNIFPEKDIIRNIQFEGT